MNIVITGEKGIGKTSVALGLLELMKTAQMQVGGIICPGHKMRDVRTGEEVDFLVAREDSTDKHTRTEHYGIDESKFTFAQERIAQVPEHSWIYFDEYGHLETKKRGLYQALSEHAENGRCIVLMKSKNLDSFFEHYQKPALVYYVTIDNRNKVCKEIFDDIQGFQ